MPQMVPQVSITLFIAAPLRKKHCAKKYVFVIVLTALSKE